MSKFKEMAAAMTASGLAKLDAETSELKTEKDKTLKLFDFKLLENDLKRTQLKNFQAQQKAEDKQKKIESDMLSSMFGQPEDAEDSSVFVGENPLQQSFGGAPLQQEQV